MFIIDLGFQWFNIPLHIFVTGIFIVAAKRTPFGAFGGSLKNKTATDLCEVAATAALREANINPELVDSTFVGNVSSVSMHATCVSL